MKHSAFSYGTALRLAAIWIAISFVPSASAQSAEAKQLPQKNQSAVKTPRTADGHPDLNGVWGDSPDAQFPIGKKDGKTYINFGVYNFKYDPKDPDHIKDILKQRDLGTEEAKARVMKNAPPYKPELLKKVEYLDAHANTLDSHLRCFPAGIPREGPPNEIIQTPSKVILRYSKYSRESPDVFRVIPTDGRKHRTDVQPTYNGDAVGHWEGDTLVVDVVNIIDDTWLGNYGWFHSDALHVIERFTRQGDVLTYEVTVEDPEVFTRPWVMNPRKLPIDRDPSHELYEGSPCSEQDLSHMMTNEHH